MNKNLRFETLLALAMLILSATISIIAVSLQYMIYNNYEVIFILKPTLKEAKEWAIMQALKYGDCYKEMIVKEVSEIKYKY